MDISGFDDLAEQAEDLADEFEEKAERAEQLDGENEVPFDELFDRQFMQEHTDSSSIDGFLDQSGWEVESQEDFEQIPEDEFDVYVRQHTEFDSWEEMFRAAGTTWMWDQLGF